MPLKLLEEPKENHVPPKLGPSQIIGIAAGKGGVGKSTLTVNLARALHHQGHSVGILDADVYGPSIRRMLPEDRPPIQKGPTLVPAICSGISMISMAYFRKEGEAAAVRAPIANSLIQHFLSQVEWGPLDYLLIDFPPGTGDVQLTLCQKARLTGALMVTTPQEISLMDVRKAIHLFQQVQVPLLGVLENMSYYCDEKGTLHYLLGKGGGERLAAEFCVPFFGQIPIAETLSLCSDLGKSPFQMQGMDAQMVSKAFLALAERMTHLAPHESLVESILRKDAHTLAIQWKNGPLKTYPFRELQKICPCAGCSAHQTLDPQVEALSVQPVGAYALKIQFTSGCSSGLYTFAALRELNL